MNDICNVKNRSGSHVVYTIPEIGVRRSFAPGEVKKITYEELVKKINNKEVVDVLNAISSSARKVLKNVKKKDMSTVSEAREMLEKLKADYPECIAAE